MHGVHLCGFAARDVEICKTPLIMASWGNPGILVCLDRTLNGGSVDQIIQDSGFISAVILRRRDPSKVDTEQEVL